MHVPVLEIIPEIKYLEQAVPNITSINPKKSKYQQKTHFAFNSSSKY